MALLALSENCTKCSICTKVCPTHAITMSENGPLGSCDDCVSCGQCVAICPTAALDNKKSPIQNQSPIYDDLKISQEQAIQFFRSRRSIRMFKKTPIPRELIEQLLNVTRYSPTTLNMQGVKYLVIDNAKIISEIREIIITWQKGMSKIMRSAKTVVDLYEQKGIDTIFFGAPCLVISMVDTNFPRFNLKSGFAGRIAKKVANRRLRGGAKNDAARAIHQAELFASILGLGTCISGKFLECAASKNRQLLDTLKLPKNMMLTGAFMVGYPQIKHKRLVERDPLQLSWMSSDGGY